MPFFGHKDLLKLGEVAALPDADPKVLEREAPGLVDSREAPHTYAFDGIPLNTGDEFTLRFGSVPFPVRYIYVEHIFPGDPISIALYTPFSSRVSAPTPTYLRLRVGQLIPVAGLAEVRIQRPITSPGGSATLFLVACSHADIFPPVLSGVSDLQHFGGRVTPLQTDLMGRVRVAPFAYNDQDTQYLFSAYQSGSGSSGAPVVLNFGIPGYRMIVTDISVQNQGATQTRFFFTWSTLALFAWEMTVGNAGASDLRSLHNALKTPLATDSLGDDFKVQVFQTGGPATWRITARGFFEDWSHYP